MSVQEQVTEFHRTFGVAINEPISEDLAELRAGLLDEECQEVTDALLMWGRMEIAKELADLVYVAYGTAVSFGIDLDLAITEVHRSNMSKLGLNGRPILRDDGKVLKGPNYQPPDMTAAVKGTPDNTNTEDRP